MFMIGVMREVELHVGRSPSLMACTTQVERTLVQRKMVNTLGHRSNAAGVDMLHTAGSSDTRHSQLHVPNMFSGPGLTSQRARSKRTK
jgi:hypothetical protein